MSVYAQYSKSAKLGVGLLVGTLLVFYILFHKDVIGTMLMSGKTIDATFQNDYKLRANVSVVKVGYVKVGKVSGIERTSDGHAKVSLKVDEDVLKALGTAPTATIRSTTLLGGNYFVDLTKGGDDGAFSGSIPLSRTAEPVELDKVARALQPGALAGAQKSLAEVNATFDKDGKSALRRFMAAAPDTLRPGARVLAAAQGDAPSDLTHVVSGLESAGAALTRTDGQLESILTNAHRLSSTLNSHRADLTRSVAELPSALSSARTGLGDLDGTLDVLRTTADDIEPVVKELDRTLTAVNPVLLDARPVIASGRAVLADARPVLSNLVPSAKSAGQVLDDLDGAVLDRLNGPVTTWLYDPYKGSGKYSLTSSKKTMYEEIVYTLVNLDRAASYADRNGNAVGFQPGIGAGTLAGLPISPEQLVKGLTSWLWPGTPINTLGPINRPTTPTKPGSSAKPGTTGSSNNLGNLTDQLSGLLGGLLGGGKK